MSRRNPFIPDARSAEAVLMRKTREALAAHCGGKPSATQAAIIDEVCWLTMYLARMNEAALRRGGVHSEHAARQYLAYSNSRTRALTKLGLKAMPAKAPRLDEILAQPPRGCAA